MDFPSKDFGTKHRKLFHNPAQVIFFLKNIWGTSIGIFPYRSWGDKPILLYLKGTLLHILQDKGWEGKEEIENFLSRAMCGKYAYFDSILPDGWWEEVVEFLNILFDGRYERKDTFIEFTTRSSENSYFQCFLDCSNHLGGHDTSLVKRIERLPKVTRRPSLIPIMTTPCVNSKDLLF